MDSRWNLSASIRSLRRVLKVGCVKALRKQLTSEIKSQSSSTSGASTKVQNSSDFMPWMICNSALATKDDKMEDMEPESMKYSCGSTPSEWLDPEHIPPKVFAWSSTPIFSPTVRTCSDARDVRDVDACNL